MNELQSVIDQLRLFTEQHIPPEMLPHIAWGAVAVVLAGIGLCVLGAKLARFGITCVFVLIGGGIGLEFAHMASFPTAPCVALGAAAVATVAFLTYRLWVGVAAAVVLGGVALGVFGYQKVMPHVQDFDPAVAWAASEQADEFTLLTPEQQEAYANPSADEWFRGLWRHVSERDVAAPQYARAIGLAAVVIGLLIGVLAVRPTLILATSIIGTFFVASGLGALAQQYMPATYQAGFGHPVVMGVLLGALGISSVIVQTLLTRKAPQPDSESSDKS